MARFVGPGTRNAVNYSDFGNSKIVAMEIRSPFFCFLPQLIPGLDNTKFFFSSEFFDSGKLPPPQAVESRNYIKKLFLEYRLLQHMAASVSMYRTTLNKRPWV